MSSRDFDVYECYLTNDQLMMHTIALKSDIVIPPNDFWYDPVTKLTSMTLCYFSFFKENDDLRIYEKGALKFINTLHEIGIYIQGSMPLEEFGNLKNIMQSGECKTYVTFVHIDKFAWLPQSEELKSSLINENVTRVKEIFCREPQYLIVTADVCNIWSKASILGAAPQMLDIKYHGVTTHGVTHPASTHEVTYQSVSDQNGEEESVNVQDQEQSEPDISSEPDVSSGSAVHMYELKVVSYTEKIDMEKFGYNTKKDEKRRHPDGTSVIVRVSKLRNQMLKIIDELHKVGIVHGNLSSETILTNKYQKDVRIVGWENARWVDPKTKDKEVHTIAKSDRKAIKSMFAIEDVE